MIGVFLMVDSTMSVLLDPIFNKFDDLWWGQDWEMKLKAGIPSRLIRKVLFFPDTIEFEAWFAKKSNPLGMKKDGGLIH